jgi:tetratricopeptide (TPR) repeat protein
MSEIAALIAQGAAAHAAGRLDEARALFAEAAAQAPRLAQPWRMLGLIAQQQGRFGDALEPTRRALAIEPSVAADHANLANALNVLGEAEAAAEAAREAVRLAPDFAAGHTNLGVAVRALGRLDAAVDSFRVAARLLPNSADVQANLGVALTETGAAQAGEAAMDAAVRLAPGWPAAWYNLGNARLRQLKFAEAEAAYAQALALDPAHADAHANRAAALKALGRKALALEHAERAAALRPADPVVLQNHGLMLCEVHSYEAAVGVFEAAVRVDPRTASLHANLGSALQEWARRRTDTGVLALLDRAILAHLAALALDPTALIARSNLGLALLARGRIDEAVAAFDTAIAQVAATGAPEIAALHSNLAQCLCDLRRLEEAEAACRRAVAIEPTLPEAWSTLGNVLVGLRRLEDAEDAYLEALRLRPEMAGAWCNLGVALFRRGKLAEAEGAYEQALVYEPAMADAHWNQALARLQRGDYAGGFAQYEWRLKRAGRLRDEALFSQPLWDGAPLDGAAILVHAEQGFGDAIQCVRFLPNVAERGGRVVLQARAPLKRLLEHAPGVDAFVLNGAPQPPVACRAPLFSLPRHFLSSVEDLPAAPIPYLTADPALREAWRARLAEAAPAGLRVGIVWSGNVTSEVEQGRSIPLAAFAPLAAIAGVRLVSLQKGDGLGELAGAPFPVVDLGPAYADGDFADTAAILAELDLLISCDTAPVHLAGALGRPVWAAVSSVADWRWLERRTDSPWYPTLRLYRQQVFGDWGEVFAQMAVDLVDLVHLD